MYEDLQFPDPPEDRPYTFINMVSTIDGKILTGERDEPVMDLGSKLDHETMRRIEASADAVLIGGGSLRATPGLYYDNRLLRIVVSNDPGIFWKPNGELRRFFGDCPERSFVATDRKLAAPKGVRQLPGNLDQLVRRLREMGVRRLLCEGGSEINASMLRADLVDELFLTLAPKIKLGREVPTYAGGEPLPRAQVQQYELVSSEVVRDEVFVRYRRHQK